MRPDTLGGPRQPAFWLFLTLLGISAIGIGAEHLSYVQAFPGAWLLSISLMTVIALPAIVLVRRFDRFEPEPVSMVIYALLWGGLVAYFFSGVANNAMLGGVQKLLSPQAFADWAAAIVAPTNEEFYKTVGLLVLFLIARREFDGVMDGLVYGAMIGLGFQAVENVQYFIEAARLAGVGGQISAVTGTFVVRVGIAGLYSHTLFSGLSGAGFAYAVTRRDRPAARRVLVFAGLLLTGWGAHFVWNSPLFSSIASGHDLLSLVALALLKGVPFLALLVLLALHARRREAAAFACIVWPEVGTDVISREELRALSTVRGRARALKEAGRELGRAGRRLERSLQTEQLKLGLVEARATGADDLAVEAQRSRIRRIREEMAALAPKSA